MAKISTTALIATITDLRLYSRKPAARVLGPLTFGAQQDKSHFVIADSGTHIVDLKLFKGHHNTKSPPLATLAYGDLLTLVGNLNKLYCSDHRNILNDPNWQTLYGRQSQNYAIMAHTKAVSTVSEISYPCHNCGFFLPDRFIQVDHHHPRFGGGNMAILKALRAYGYTTQHASGPKGKAVGSSSYAFIPPKGSAPARRPRRPNATL